MFSFFVKIYRTLKEKNVISNIKKKEKLREKNDLLRKEGKDSSKGWAKIVHNYPTDSKNFDNKAAFSESQKQLGEKKI